MSSELTKVGPPGTRNRFSRNTMVFPRELRDAIPDLPTYVGRALQLDSMSAEPSQSQLFGPRVHLSLVVRETGKLNGEYAVRLDLETASARALAASLIELADHAEKMEPSPFPI